MQQMQQQQQRVQSPQDNLNFTLQPGGTEVVVDDSDEGGNTTDPSRPNTPLDGTINVDHGMNEHPSTLGGVSPSTGGAVGATAPTPSARAGQQQALNTSGHLPGQSTGTRAANVDGKPSPEEM